MIKIFGAKGYIKNVDTFLKEVKKFAEKNKIIIQVFNADKIFGKKHIISAYEHAKRARNNKTNTTNSLDMEIMLYAAGERQLKHAIPKIGVKQGDSNIGVVFIGKSNRLIKDFLKEMNLKRDDKVLEGNKNTLMEFGLTKKEIDTVTVEKYGDLILEKVAMVDIIK